MGTLVQDVRSGFRQLLAHPGSSVVAVLTLALGIGPSTAAFSVIDATMLRPLPYPAPEELVTMGVEIVGPDGRAGRLTPSMEDVRTWQAATDVFSVVAGAGSAFRGRIADGTEPERLQVAHYTEDYLAMHGVAPILGRGFVRADTDPGAPLVALLGYGYWQHRFGGRDDVVGETLRLDADVATIVGVLPSWFNPETPVVTPLQIAPGDFARRGTGRVSAYGRLRPGITVEQAAERLTARRAAAATADGTPGDTRVYVVSRLDTLTSRYEATIRVLGGAVALIVALAAVNVAGLLLARGAARHPEVLVRASLGARRGRLVRQLLTESAVLALPGMVIGVLLAWLTLDLIVANLPLTMPPNAPVGVNLTVLALTVALLVPTTLLFGLVPAMRLSRVGNLSVVTRGRAAGGGSLSRRGGQLLIAAEVALAVVLVAGAGLMIRSFLRITAVPLGFAPDGLIAMQALPLDRDPAAHKAYYWALQQELAATPGIASAGIVDNFPLGGGGSYTAVEVDGTPTSTSVFGMTPGYLETIGATLLAGRLPAPADDASAFRGVVVNESAARALFGDQSAVGRELRRRNEPDPWTVVGVVADIRHGGPLADVSDMRGLQVFFPLEPTEFSLNAAMTVVVRPAAGAGDVPNRLRQVAQGVGPRVLIESIRSADELFGATVITARRQTVLLGLLGTLGLTLALVGVFAMTAYAVGRRTGEIGVRMAIGARRAQVVGTMLRDAAAPIVLGTIAGVAASLAAGRVIASFLFETAPHDPPTLAAVAVGLLTTGGLAALVPALRAARVDPATTLRSE